MDKNKAEYEINLIDVFWEICMKWKQILVWMILFAFLAAGVSYVNNLNEIKAANQSTLKDKVSAEVIDLTSSEKDNVDLVLEYQNLYDSQLVYTTESLYMQLDANSLCKGTVSYYVNNHYQLEYPYISKKNNIGALVFGYANLFEEGQFIDSLGEILQIDDSQSVYAKELVKCTANQEDGTIMIDVLTDDEEKSKAIIALIEKTMEKAKDDFAMQIEEHDLLLLDETVNWIYDEDVLEKQKLQKEKLFSYASNLDTLESKLTDKEKSYVELCRSEKQLAQAQTEIVEPVTPKPSVSKKMTVMGMILGALLAIIVYFVKYVFNNKLRVEDAFERIFGVKVLGIVEKTDSKKGINSSVQRFLSRKRRASQRIFFKDEALELVAVSVKVMAKKMGYSKVFLTGAAMNHCEDDRVVELKAMLEKMGVELIVGNSVLYFADAFEELSDVGAVLFWEKAGESMYGEIEAEIQKCMSHKIDVIGAVVAE